MTILDGDSRILGPWSTEPSRIQIELQDGLDRNLTKELDREVGWLTVPEPPLPTMMPASDLAAEPQSPTTP